MLRFLLLNTACFCFTALSLATEPSNSKLLRAGIIGLDTSHVVAFTKTLNTEKPKPEAAGVRVVAAWPGGSADIPSSINRVRVLRTMSRNLASRLWTRSRTLFKRLMS